MRPSLCCRPDLLSFAWLAVAVLVLQPTTDVILAPLFSPLHQVWVAAYVISGTLNQNLFCAQHEIRCAAGVAGG